MPILNALRSLNRADGIKRDRLPWAGDLTGSLLADAGRCPVAMNCGIHSLPCLGIYLWLRGLQDPNGGVAVVEHGTLRDGNCDTV